MFARRRVSMTLIAAGLAACSGNERYGELVGSYDISTTLETLSYQIPGAVPGVDCAGTSPCYRQEPAGGAKLSATMSIRAGSDRNEVGASVFNATGHATATWCAAIDKTTGCTALRDSSFSLNGTYVQATDITVTVRLEQAPFYGSLLQMTSPPLQGDSLVGHCTWAVPPAPTGPPPVYIGRCIAHKRK